MFGASSATTFLGFPSATSDELDGVDVAIIGAPCATPYASVGPYCANAPAAIRRASWTYSSTTAHMNFDLGGPAVPAGSRVVDLGDVEWDASDFAANRERIAATVAAVLSAGAVPIVLGGDDSIPIPVIGAYAAHADTGRLAVLQIDAHIDWRDDVQGERMGLSSTMRRSSEMNHVGEMIQVGRRGVGSARPADLAAATKRGVHFIGARNLHHHGVEHVASLVPTDGAMFITIDVDGLDPSVVPGVIGPEPGGLSYTQAIDLIDAVAVRTRIAGFDVVEYVPERDVNNLGALTTFRLAAHALGRILEQRAR